MTDRFRQDELIALTYSRLSESLLCYVYRRIGDVEESRDIVQDVFEYLMKPGLLISAQTVNKYVYTIAHSMVVDWMRRHACTLRARDFFLRYSPKGVDDAQNRACVNEIIDLENKVLSEVGEKGVRIYMMAVHGQKSVKEIARNEGLSERTVENHLFRTRKKVREFLKEAL